MAVYDLHLVQIVIGGMWNKTIIIGCKNMENGNSYDRYDSALGRKMIIFF